MPRSEAPVLSGPVAGKFLAAALLAGSLSNAAVAHVLLISRGEAIIGKQDVRMEIRVVAEDFLHHYGLAEGFSGFLREELMRATEGFGGQLRELFSIRDAAGRRVACDPFVSGGAWTAEYIDLEALRQSTVTYSSKCNGIGDPRFLTFQLWGSGPATPVPWQLALWVHGQHQEVGPTLRLTSRGNAETIALSAGPGGSAVVVDQAAAACQRCDQRLPGALKYICAEFDVSPQEFRAAFYVPLPLLSTWLDLERGDPHFLTAAEQDAARTGIGDLLRNAVLVGVEGSPGAVEVTSVAFVPLLGESGAPGVVAFWTGRVRAELRVLGGLPDGGVLTWRLFNDSVLTAVALLRDGGGCEDLEFSTYTPSRLVGR